MGVVMKNLKLGLILLVTAASLGLTACGKKQEEQTPATTEASAPAAAESSAVTSIEVSEDMIDAAPLEQEGSSASEATAK
jgi:guanyl-specific ribonuclease Sa